VILPTMLGMWPLWIIFSHKKIGLIHHYYVSDVSVVKDVEYNLRFEYRVGLGSGKWDLTVRKSDDHNIKVHLDPWWDIDFTSFIICSISDPVAGCEMFLNVSYLAGGDNVSCNSLCQNDFEDIRFLDIDNSTVLDAYIESKVDGAYCYFWIELPNDIVADGKFLMYFGNAGASHIYNDGHADFMSVFDAGDFSWDFENLTIDANLNVYGWVNEGSDAGHARDDIPFERDMHGEIQDASTLNNYAFYNLTGGGWDELLIRGAVSMGNDDYIMVMGYDSAGAHPGTIISKWIMYDSVGARIGNAGAWVNFYDPGWVATDTYWFFEYRVDVSGANTDHNLRFFDKYHNELCYEATNTYDSDTVDRFIWMVSSDHVFGRRGFMDVLSVGTYYSTVPKWSSFSEIQTFTVVITIEDIYPINNSVIESNDYGVAFSVNISSSAAVNLNCVFMMNGVIFGNSSGYAQNFTCFSSNFTDEAEYEFRVNCSYPLSVWDNVNESFNFEVGDVGGIEMSELFGDPNSLLITAIFVLMYLMYKLSIRYLGVHLIIGGTGIMMLLIGYDTIMNMFPDVLIGIFFIMGCGLYFMFMSIIKLMKGIGE